MAQPVSRTFLTAASIGVVAMVLADMVHEALGHGTACWITGNRILSLSTVAIQTAEASRFVSAAGTTANCLVGAMSLVLFSRFRKFTALACFCWLFGLFNLLNSGYLVASAATNTSDWANVIAGLSPAWLWRCLLAAAGVVVYVVSLNWAAWTMIPRVASGEVGLKDLSRITLAAYLAAGIAMTVASIFNPIGPQLILASGAGPSFGLNAGVLFIPRMVAEHVRKQPATTHRAGFSAALSPIWIALGLLCGVLFIAVLGPGIHFSQ